MDKQTYADIKAELAGEILDISDYELGRAYQKYVNKMVDTAMQKLDAKAKHYIEVGEAAEKFFSSMRIGK